MTWPAGLATVTVDIGPLLHSQPPNLPCAGGQVVLTPEWELVQESTGAVVLREGVVAVLDEAGMATVVVPASDASGLSRTEPYRYLVSFNLGLGLAEPRPFWALLPAAKPRQLLLPSSVRDGLFVPTIQGPQGEVGPPGSAIYLAADPDGAPVLVIQDGAPAHADTDPDGTPVIVIGA